MFKFLHLADVHLDTTFLCRSDTLRARLRSALRVAFKRSVDCAIEEDVHAVLIAGDLFDNDRLSFATEQFLLEQLHRLDANDIPCFYVTGNHDPGGRKYRNRRMEWPKSFRFVGESGPISFTVRDSSGDPMARIVAAGHVTNRDDENLAASFPAAADRLPHIGLLHTYVTSAEQAASHDRYAPCSLEDLRRVKYRYWALGHVHRRQQVCDIAEAWYPGNIQGRHPRETGAKGGNIVILDGSGPARVTFRSFAPVGWADIILDNLEDVHTAGDLVGLVEEAIEETAADVDGADDWLVRVVLSGRTPLVNELREAGQLKDLEEILATRLRLLDVHVKAERIASPIDVEQHRGEPHLLGSVLQLMEDAGVDSSLLLQLAPDALSREFHSEDEKVDYLRSLLQGLESSAAERLLIQT